MSVPLLNKAVFLHPGQQVSFAFVSDQYQTVPVLEMGLYF